jgi:hypothetical protein
MSFGRPYIMKTEGCIPDGWLVLHKPKVDPDYLYYALSSDLIFNQFDRLAAGSTVRNLNIGMVKSVEIPVLQTFVWVGCSNIKSMALWKHARQRTLRETAWVKNPMEGQQGRSPDAGIQGHGNAYA